jgi:hypothetical protein
MNSDSYFEIGSSHLVCQDYALSGSYKDMHYGIVSDGCSSAMHSEIGAQILCHVARYNIQLYYDLFFYLHEKFLMPLLGNSILKRADEIRKIYPINIDALQATLLIIVAKENRAQFFGWGDGYFIIKTSNRLHHEKIDYPETNAPFYLSTDRESYIDKFGSNTSKIRTENDIGYARQAKIEEAFDEPSFHAFIDLSLGDTITITTDGLGQYLDQNKNSVPDQDIISQIIDYPSIKGTFVKRTMNFLKRDMLKKDWSHTDDIGLATISV